MVKQKLEDKWKNLRYIAFIRDQHKDVVQMVEESVYTWWDGSNVAPSKTRPHEATADPNLCLLLWEGGRPRLPSSVLDKFARGTEQFNAVMDFDKDLKKKWPEPNAAHQPPPPTSKGPTTVTTRATGSPDFTGTDVLDLTREVDLMKIPSESFAEERRLSFAYCSAVQ